jgi:hypothetical protein
MLRIRESNMIVMTADNVAIAVLVPVRHLMKIDVSTYNVPQLLLETVQQG